MLTLSFDTGDLGLNFVSRVGGGAGILPRCTGVGGSWREER